MSQTLIWSVGLMAGAMLCLVLEFFVPSAGLLGIGAAIAMVAAVVLAFSDSTWAGVTMSTVVAVGVPAVFFVAIRMWPHTPIGRRVLNLPDPTDAPEAATREDDRMARLRQLVGRVGVARTHLLPSGLIEIDGRRYDAVAQGTAVDRDSFVEVFSVEAGKIRVRPTNRRPAPAGEPAGPPSEEALAQRTLEDLDLEDLGDPLA